MKCFRAALGLGLLGLCCLPSGSPAGRASWDEGCRLPCPLAAPLVPVTLAPVTLAPVGCAGIRVAEPMPIEPGAIEPVDPPTPVVKIKVRVPACGAPGQNLEYRIGVENCSAADAHHVVVRNPLPANARFVRASPEPHVKEPEIQWRLGTLKAGGSCELVLILQPTNKEDVKNCTRVQFEHGQCVTTRLAGMAAPGTTPPGTKGPETGPPPIITPEEGARLTLAIDGPKKQYVNLPARYFVTVANQSMAAATNVLVDFALAQKTTFVQASDKGTFLAGKVAWLLGTLEPGAKRTVVVALKAEAAGEYCHKATVLADKNVKAQAEICTTFAGVSALTWEMVDRVDPIAVGEGTSYPIMIRNTGSAPVTNLSLRTFIPDALLLTRAVAKVKHDLGERVPGGKLLVFEPMPMLEAGAQVEYEVFVRGAKPGDVRFRVEMRADQLESGPVIEEESTRVYSEEGGGGLPRIIQTRRKSQTMPYQP